MNISLLLPQKLRKNIETDLISVRLNLTLNELIAYIALGGIALAIIILLLFFKDPIKLAPNFVIALIEYFLLSYLIAVGIGVFTFYSIITLKKVKRKREIELVLSDYLQLVAANLHAGMTIDQSLWYAVRERFGVLSEEIELLARKVAAGIDLEQALIEFAKSYDSDLLYKSIILLIEGIKSGGELSELVNKIAWNIKETQLLEKEIAAETTTYTVFVIFAALFAAPALYALAHRIILIMTAVTSQIDVSSTAGISTPIPLTLSGQAITAVDFKTFAIINLFLTSTISAMIISKIKKGGVRPGLKLIPVFILTSILLFLIIIVLLGGLFKDFVV